MIAVQAMELIANLKGYCEARFKVGEPTSHRLSVTGEPYVEFTPSLQPSEVGSPGQVFETPDAAIDAAKVAFDAYASGRSGAIYWRIEPELARHKKGYALYMRLLVSNKDPLPSQEK